jgi:hypothetical protein
MSIIGRQRGTPVRGASYKPTTLQSSRARFLTEARASRMRSFFAVTCLEENGPALPAKVESTCRIEGLRTHFDILIRLDIRCLSIDIDTSICRSHLGFSREVTSRSCLRHCTNRLQNLAHVLRGNESIKAVSKKKRPQAGIMPVMWDFKFLVTFWPTPLDCPQVGFSGFLSKIKISNRNTKVVLSTFEMSSKLQGLNLPIYLCIRYRESVSLKEANSYV